MAIFFKDIAKNYGEAGEIKFFSVITGETISFPAFITGFNDSYNASFGGETIFGRNDPVKHYQATSRTIQTTFDILGVNLEDAKQNLIKYSKMIQLLYPVYSSPIGGQNKARTIKAPPLWRIKYANYIYSNNENGLLGVLSGLNFQPDFDKGTHIIRDGDQLIPKGFQMSFTFEPLHEEPLGTVAGGKNFITPTFPYNMNVQNFGIEPISLDTETDQ